MAPKPPKQSKPVQKSRKNVALYPASHIMDGLSQSALALKIARHSRCPLCSDCQGLTPKDEISVKLDSEWDERTMGPAAYLDSCRCGHTVAEHAAAEDVPREEYKRRGRVAIRLDELLDDTNQLWNFDYRDEDILSLRKQMRLPEEALSPLSNDLASPGIVFHVLNITIN
ncbi:hypothetical protein M422DRAFT_161147 [Sphaerobolus stellatus SS14]|nr:hypothetical protein M422DRAFT_161147 [Sphaerobolus stellatus SS14]